MITDPILLQRNLQDDVKCAAFVTGKQAYVETLKLLWLDLTWCSCGIPGSHGVGLALASQRPWFDFYEVSELYRLYLFMTCIPYTVYQPEFRNMKTKTSYFGTHLFQDHHGFVSVSFIQHAHVFFLWEKKSGSPNLWWPELGLLSSAMGFFGRGPPPEKEKEKHRSPKHQFLGPSR